MPKLSICVKRFFLGSALFAALLGSCAKTTNERAKFEKTDEILTFEVPQDGKEIVRIGFAMNMDWKPLIAALNAKFPTKQFIYDFDVTSGISIPNSTIAGIVEKKNYDFVVSNYWNAPNMGANITNESFLDKYLPTALNAIADNGEIYGIPLPTSASGIYYNKTLFKEKGWEMPSSTADFLTLTKTIKQAGYGAFNSCFKYEGQIVRVLQGMLYDELFSKPEGMAWYQKLIAGKATFSEYALPFFETAKTLLDEGAFPLDGFTASLTTMRKDFFAGKSAMIDYSSDIYTLATTEGCPFEIGLAPYPSTTGKNSPVLYSSSVILYIPAAIKNDAKRYAFDTSVLDYLSTTEGQDAVLTGWNGVPSLKSYLGHNALYDEVSPYIQSGNFHSVLDFAADQEMVKPLKSLMRDAVYAIGKGASVATAVSDLDTAYRKTLTEGIVPTTYSKIAEAKEDFTVLETSYYLADKLKAATNSDVALMPSGGFYRSNMAFIPKGDITDDTRLFYHKGLGPKEYVTTYSMTGSQLKTLLEQPIINSSPVDQFIAPSGLKVSYAPWHKKGNRLVEVSFEDGTALEDTKTYTVAAYAGMIDPSYLSATLTSFPALGDPQALALASFKEDKTIAPAITNRLLLKWDVEE